MDHVNKNPEQEVRDSMRKSTFVQLERIRTRGAAITKEGAWHEV